MNPFPIIIGLLLVLFFAIIIVREATAVIIERLGKYHRVARAGFTLRIPGIDRKAATMNLRVQQNFYKKLMLMLTQTKIG